MLLFKIYIISILAQIDSFIGVFGNGQKNSKTKCQQMRSDSFKKRGSFTPKCNRDGTFAPRQCSYTRDVITCWNVDSKGRKTSNDTHFYLGTKSKPTAPAASTALPTVLRPLSKCELKRQRRVKKIKKASYVPECTKNGHFKKEQCTTDKKKCWCVDKEGDRIPGTKVQNTRAKCYSDDCGQRFGKPPTRKRRVVGGREARPNTWPWQALVLFSDPKHICGGTLVRGNWLVTAASCFDDFTTRAAEWSVRLGAHDRHTTASPQDTISVLKIHIHPQYTPGNKTHPGDYDVALIEISSSDNIAQSSRPLCLPNTLGFYHKGARCSITGWGYTANNGTLANKLREAWVDLVPISECNANESYDGVITDRFMCAGFREGGVDACHFDTGGPLACPVQGGRWALAGIISWRQRCAEPYKYGVYTNVHVIKPWIDQLTMN